jgi:peptidoglycan/xylan/chitin deacetylase (PgdA/CDA1 family)
MPVATETNDRRMAVPPDDEPVSVAHSGGTHVDARSARPAERRPAERPSRLARLRGVIAINLLYATAFAYVVVLALPLFTDAPPAPLKKISPLEYLLHAESQRGRADQTGPARDALPAPPSVTRAARERFEPIARTRRSVPVLAYHGIGGDRTDPYSVTRQAFEAQMAMLSRAGFHAISPAQYLRFLAGDRHGLPQRPILITFDDGRLDSYRGADAVLARYGFRATMYVIAGRPASRHRFYLSWDELRGMQRSGRWDIQEHAGRGHRLVRYNARGDRGPSYAYRMWRNGALESFPMYKQRVVRDIAWGDDAIRRNVPGVRLDTFAVPYGNYGQLRSNDRRIAAFLGGFLRRRFAAVFVQQNVGFTTAKTSRERLGRYEMTRKISDMRLYRWLRRNAKRAG